MADGIITPGNVARSWHWFRQVTAPCNAACGSWIVTVNSPSGSTLQCNTWFWYDMPLNSPGGSTLQCDTWLVWYADKLARWQHPAMWHIALGSWHPIRQVAALCNVAGGSRTTCLGIRPNVCRIEIQHLISILIISPQSTCILHQSAKFYPNRTTLSRKNDVISIFKMADLGHLGF